MNFTTMTNEAVAIELGKRIEQMRLEQNLTQQNMADEIGLSRLSYRRLEMGEAKLLNVIAALRVLGQLHMLEQALPKEIFSPLEQLKLAGKKRQRATSKTPYKNTEPQTESDKHPLKISKNHSDELDW